MDVAKMKQRNFIPLVILISAIVLFFFPEPETHLLAYLGTMAFFITLVIFLVIKFKGKK